MAGRLNTRLVIIVLVVFLLVLGAGAGLYMLAVHRSYDERMADADAFMEAGDFGAAAREYGKIVHNTNDLEALRKFFDANRRMEVTHGPPAYAALERLLSIATQGLREAPDDLVMFSNYMDIYMQLGRSFNQITSWTEMYDRAHQSLDAAPDFLVARKYRGLAQVQRMLLGLNLDDATRLSVRRDLEAYLESRPEDLEAIFHLACGYVIEARVLELQRNAPSVQVRALREKGIALTGETRIRHPHDPARGMDHVRLLLMAGRNDEARKIIDEIEQLMLRSPGTRHDTLTLLDLITAGEPGSGGAGARRNISERVEVSMRRHKILEAAIDANPDDLVMKLAYARSASAIGDRDEALRISRQIGQGEVRRPAIEAFVQTFAQRMASVHLTDLMLEEAETLEAGAERDALLSEIEANLKALQDLKGEMVSMYHLLYGVLHSLRNEWVDAVQHLRKANDEFKGKSPIALQRLAVALAETGQGGAAAETLGMLLQLDGMASYREGFYQLVELYIRNKQYGVARRQIEAILADDPQDETGLQLKVELALALGDVDGTIELLKRQDADDPELPLRIAKVHLHAGQLSVARTILEELFAQRPRDPDVLSLLVRAGAERTTLLGYLAKAEAAGLEAEWIDELKQQLRGDIEPVDVVLNRIDKIDDPFEQHVQRHVLFVRMGDMERAAAEFAQARSLRSDHPWVIRTGFARALAERDGNAAKAYAQDAARLNVDRASGYFFIGRLDLFHGAYARAASSLREGLARRPDYAVGWRLLGDAERSGMDHEGAREAYARAIDLKPDSIGALRGMAATHAAVNQHEQALAYLKQVRDMAPDDRAVRSAYIDYVELHGDQESALRLRGEVAESDPQDLANQRRLAHLLAASGQYAQAREVLNRLVEAEGDTTLNAVRVASVMQMAGEPQAADEHLAGFIAALGDDVSMEDWLILGRFRVESGKLDAAGESFEKAIALEDDVARPATREWASHLLAAGRLDDAEAIFRRLHEAEPENRRIAYQCIELMMRRDLEQASSMLDRLIDRKPDDHGYVLRSMIATRQGNTALALEALDQAVVLSPDRAMNHLKRAQLLVSLGRTGEALSGVNRALGRDPANLEARMLRAMIMRATGERQEAIAELQQVLSRRPDFAPARLDLADLYVETGELRLARRVLEESMELFPEDWRWPHRLSKLDWQEKASSSAVQNLRKAFELGETVELLNELAVTLIMSRRHQEALDLLQGAPEWLEEHPMLHATLGWVLGELNRTEEAIEAFERAIAGGDIPGNYQTITTLMSRVLGAEKATELLERSVNDDNEIPLTILMAGLDVRRDDARSAVERLVAIDGKVAHDAEFRHRLDDMLSGLLTEVGRYDEARTAYERVVARNPRDVRMLNNLAYLVGENLDSPADALPYIERAAKLAPDDPRVLDTLGWMQFKVGRRQDGRENLVRSVEIVKLPANCYHLAVVMDSLQVVGTRGETLDWARRALRLAEREQDEQTRAQAAVLVKKLEPIGGTGK
ncbi:MAG: hypothetical protein CMJ18_23655 [Phycisphaeraceae bacterium]|nr:hypothetical protein [Phycisphaeraceae bacterium]